MGMTENPNRKLTSLRLPKKLLDDFTAYAEANGVSKTHIMETLVEALLEGRLTMRPRSGPNAFPAEEMEIGSVPECPARIAWGVREDA